MFYLRKYNIIWFALAMELDHADLSLEVHASWGRSLQQVAAGLAVRAARLIGTALRHQSGIELHEIWL